MASRAEDLTERRPAGDSPSPRLGMVIRASFSDYYFNSMRLVVANVVWGATLVLAILVGFVWPIGGVLLLPLVALPTAGVFRLAARIVRGDSHAGLHDVAWPYRHAAAWVILFGVAIVGVSLVLGTNVVVGLSSGDPLGWAIATFAGWGLVALWSAALVAWPLVVDPARAARPLRERLRLAGSLLLVDPVRFGALGLAVAVVSVLSTVLTVAILTVSVSFVALVACRSVFPAADRFEAALGGERS